MHISEGILSGGMLAVGWAGTVAGVSFGLKRTDPDKIIRTALVSSAFFLASLVNIRIGPSSTHLSLLAPMGLILGYSVFPAVFTALLLQAVLFGFGGLVVLGANTMVMGLPALVSYIIFGKVIREGSGKTVAFMSFMAGALAVMMGAGLSGAFLGFSDSNFLGAVKLLMIAHVPLALVEGAVTSFLMMWLKKSAPEFLS
ncbi:MAG: cobalt transporter CbiM [Synergistaceae bacterium]|nr:cobalt transporter CbiM [Synergistaceae bacterium]MBQ3757931.1 cobalt transporter CbiM [Synergistaceae bacterium]